MTHARRLNLTTAAAAGFLLTVTLAACGTTPVEEEAAPAEQSASPAAEDSVSAAVHNDADTKFSQMMIVHHEGAVEMAELAIERADSAEVRALAERIAVAQGPEIETMTSWLGAWGEEHPAEMDMGGMDHGGMEMDGMDQETVMAELSELSGGDFDRRFLELMTAHHRGAIEMAEEHRGDGENPEAVRLSGAIIDAQTLEITEMTNLLRAL